MLQTKEEEEDHGPSAERSGTANVHRWAFEPLRPEQQSRTWRWRRIRVGAAVRWDSPWPGREDRRMRTPPPTCPGHRFRFSYKGVTCILILFQHRMRFWQKAVHPQVDLHRFGRQWTMAGCPTQTESYCSPQEPQTPGCPSPCHLGRMEPEHRTHQIKEEQPAPASPQNSPESDTSFKMFYCYKINRFLETFKV